MRLQIVFVLCGITIFVVSSAFAGILAFYYNINPTFIFLFLTLEAVIIFIITTVFLRRHYDYIFKNISMLIDGDDKYDPDVLKETGVKEITTAHETIKKGQK